MNLFILEDVFVNMRYVINGNPNTNMNSNTKCDLEKDSEILCEDFA